MEKQKRDVVAEAHLSHKGYIILEFFQEDMTLSVNEVRYGWEIANKLDPSKKTPVFLKTAKWSLLDLEARNFAIKEIKSHRVVAILVHQLGQKLMGNFAVNLIGKSKTIRVFEKEKEAIHWLQQKLQMTI